MKNTVDATSEYNNMGLQMGTQANEQFGYKSQENIGEMSYYQKLDEALKGLQGTQYAAKTYKEHDYNAGYLQGVDMNSSRDLEGQQGYNRAMIEQAQINKSAQIGAANIQAQNSFNNSLKNGQMSDPTTLKAMLAGAETVDEYIYIMTSGSNGTISTKEARDMYNERKTKQGLIAEQKLIDQQYKKYVMEGNVHTQSRSPALDEDLRQQKDNEREHTVQ